MNVITNKDGTVTVKYDGNNYIGVSNSIQSNAFDTISTIATAKCVSSVLDEITKKPEVRADQRSSLKITNNIVANFYKDGFFTDSKHIVSAIRSVEVFNENTVKVVFANGNIQKSTVQKGDTFSLEDGLLRCIVKEMIGKEGNAILSKLLSYAVKVYTDAEADKKKKIEEEEKKRIASEKNRKKLQKHWEKKRAMEREKRIQEMAEAIVRAKEMEKK